MAVDPLALDAPALDPRAQFVVGVSPFERPDPRLTSAVLRAGALGVLDLGRDIDVARLAVSELLDSGIYRFGVRVPEGCPLMPEHFSADPSHVILAECTTGEEIEIWRGPDRLVFVEVRSLDEAVRAVGFGADGLVLRGSESGGRVGEETSLVLLSRISGKVSVPLWLAGGIGIHTAAGAIAGGAAKVVLDSQLALLRESSINASIQSAVASMDGSETAVICGYRVLMRPGLKSAEVLTESDPNVIRELIGGEDLASELLEIGQDGAFASSIARRWVTAGAAVTGISRQIVEHLRAARKCRSLEPDAPLAREHKTRYPIAQGPMTRVSDNASFALEVARAGGLPFLALSLMTGAESRVLLEETAELLGEMRWGVGILGFVPPEVRSEQLEVIHEIAPSVVLIAGGRPSQAKPLEQIGITTYLHVPSPGLLKMFLKEGARHFVFEGRECGGHVGPRSSFSLWESQIETVIHSGSASEVSVLFAGGIHDARSAAVVASVSGTLAAAGGRVGVLMGTAYLFTKEAVTTGAIKPGFQAEAIECDRTVLLETAPGHATRCVDSEYVSAFTAERDRLSAAGLDQNEIWAELEVFNLGRLRIASKGLIRRGAEIAEVNEEVQKSEGMYMIGQVASLHDEVTDVASLHEDVSVGSVTHLLNSTGSTGETVVYGNQEQSSDVDIAIIGIACILPGAPDKETYWANIVAGKDAIVEVPPERWDPKRYFDPSALSVDAGKKTPSKWGGFIPYVPFDALEYGIPPRSLAAIEPVQLLSLQVAADALRDAGYAHDGEREFNREKVSVIFGAEAGTDLASAYGFRSLATQYLGVLPDYLDELLPELTEDSFPGMLTNVIAGRIANRLDLGGINYTVDAACASSIAALDAGVKELRAGSSEMVICGGADLHNGINDYLLFSAVHALSPKGRCLSFDAQADGISLGEGVACVLLKRLNDARRDGDRVYAVVKGVGGSSDGRSLGLTAPRPEGQLSALKRAYESAGISPCEVGLVEAHGTGTVLGDRTELRVLTELFLESGASPLSCVLGSVKSQIGHTKCAAGLASLIKAALAIHHRVLPPTLNLSEPNDGYDSASSPFRFNLVARPWIFEKRVAGVSAFGFGGTNFHAVLESADDETPFGSEIWPAELFIYRGTPASVLDSLNRTLDYVGAVTSSLDALGLPGEDQRWEILSQGGKLRDLAASVSKAGSGDPLVALVACSFDDLSEKLRVSIDALNAEVESSDEATQGFLKPREIGDAIYLSTATVADRRGIEERPKVAFLYPGQGSQKPGMLSELLVTFNNPARVLVDGDRWISKLLPEGAFTPEQRKQQEAAITDTRVAQPTLGIAGVFMSDLLKSVGVSPDMSGGHSYGELVALAMSAAFPRERLLDLSQRRAEVILEAAGADPGAMAAVTGGLDQVRSALGNSAGVVVANDNSPNQVVISGRTEAVTEAVSELTSVGLRAKRLPVACAFHSPVVASAVEKFGEVLGGTEFQPCRNVVFSNVTAAPFPSDAGEIRNLTALQLGSSVRFREQVEAMYDSGARVFVECGPGRVLTGLVARILEGKAHEAIAADGSGRGDLRGFLKSLARLAVCGVAVDEEALFEGRATPFDLTAAPTSDIRWPDNRWPDNRWPDIRWLVNGHLVRDSSGRVLEGALQPATAFAHRELVEKVDGPRKSSPQAQLPGAGELSVSKESLTRRAPAPENAGVPAVVVEPGREQLVVEYLRGLREVVVAGKEVMLGLIGSQPQDRERIHELERAVVERPSADPVREDRPELSVTPAGIEPGVQTTVGDRENGGTSSAGEAQSERLQEKDVRERVLAVVSERTGYPLDMLKGSLDLEADLSIDSIKRLEIVGELAERVGLLGGTQGAAADLDDTVVEELVAIKTLDGIVEWILETAGADTGVDTGADSGVDIDGSGEDPAQEMKEGLEVPGKGVRMVPKLIELEVAGAVELSRCFGGQRVVMTDDGTGIGAALLKGLEDSGAKVQVLNEDGAVGPVDIFIHLEALNPWSDRCAVRMFEYWKKAFEAGASRLVAVTAMDAALGEGSSLPPVDLDTDATGSGFEPLRFVGMRGVAKTFARELADVSALLVDIPASIDPLQAADILANEIAADDGLVEVGRSSSRRVTSEVVEEDLLDLTDGRALDLVAGSVVVVTGGARGIGARVANSLAQRVPGCRIVLVGRTKLPESPEEPLTVDARDEKALRRALAESRFGSIGEIEERVRELIAQREVQKNLDAIGASGAKVEYRCADIGSRAKAVELIDGVYRDYGRLDGLIHAAGILEDAKISDKTVDSFERVFDTKCSLPLVLEEVLKPRVKFVVFFSSIAGVFGNAGQVDYSSANDALGSIARHLQDRLDARVLAISWGPWAGGGMVSPELEREFERRGIGLLDPDDGVSRVFQELASNAREPEVVIARARVERFAMPSPSRFV